MIYAIRFYIFIPLTMDPYHPTLTLIAHLTQPDSPSTKDDTHQNVFLASNYEI